MIIDILAGAGGVLFLCLICFCIAKCFCGGGGDKANRVAPVPAVNTKVAPVPAMNKVAVPQKLKREAIKTRLIIEMKFNCYVGLPASQLNSAMFDGQSFQNKV